MTESINRTGTYNVDHTAFGGIIYISDFNTDYRGKDNTHGSTIAKRIMSDKQLDKQWRKNKENRQNNGGTKNDERNDETKM